MSAIKDGGPAFPIPIAGCNDGGVYNTMEQSQGQLGGMSLRDYFAAKAMQGWFASNDSTRLLPPGVTFEANRDKSCQDFYRWADAMLAAREGGAKRAAPTLPRSSLSP